MELRPPDAGEDPRNRGARTARRMLLLVALFEVGLFALHHGEHWARVLLPKGLPQTIAGEGLVIGGDGFGYYAWLRSPLIDGDLSFDNEFAEHTPLVDPASRQISRTAIGRCANQWSVGPACVWATTVVPGHLLCRALDGHGLPWPADGYSLPYQLLVGATTVAVALLGLALLYGLCRSFARPLPAALTATVMTLGTTVVYYNAVEVSMAHAFGTTALAALAWYWVRTYGSDAPARWFLLGALVGAAALMRYQLAAFALLPAGEAVLRLRAPHRGRRLLGLALAGIGCVVVFSPQMVAWRCVYGFWLGSPLRPAHNWLSPALWDVLGSHDRSLFYWTPVTLVACAGFVYAWTRRPAVSNRPTGPQRGAVLVMLAASFAVQVYALASIRGTEIYLGSSFGFRLLTESVVVLAPGLAVLLDQTSAVSFRRLALLGCGLTIWNLLLLCEYRYNLVPVDAGAGPGALLANLVPLACRKPHVVLGALIVPVWIGWRIRRDGACRHFEGAGTIGAHEKTRRSGSFALQPGKLPADRFA